MTRDRLSPLADPRTRTLTGSVATAELAQLGLPGHIVRQAVEHGAGTARASASLGYPRIYSGLRMWAESGNALVELGYEHGWEREHFGGVEPLVNRTIGCVIIVTAGDGATGEEHYQPQVRYDRPDLVQNIVRGGLNNLLTPTRDDWQVWFLLHNLNVQERVAGPVQAELSQPEDLDDGYVTGWITRILIAGTDGGEGVATRKPDAEPSEPVVTIRRRAS